jgi:hypothetical protein
VSKAERQRRWIDKKTRTGMTRMELWVPADRTENVRQIVRDFIQYPNMRVIGVKREEPVFAPEPWTDADAYLPGLSYREALQAALDGLDEGELTALAGFCKLLVTSRD